jgi:hypothetical protein
VGETKELAFAIAKTLPQSTGRRSLASTAFSTCLREVRPLAAWHADASQSHRCSGRAMPVRVRKLMMGFSRMQREDPVRIIRIPLGPGRRGTDK